MLRQNVIANYVGQIWRVIMAVGFVPVYIDLIGIEAYGLVGIFAILQAWVSLLDMGLRPAISREMAKYTAGVVSQIFIYDLLRTIEIITLILAVIIVSIVFAGSEWLSLIWISAEGLENDEISSAFVLMGVIVALNFIESLYSSCLGGLQKQVVQNVILIVVSTFKGLGTVVVLSLLSPTIKAFFLWQAICVVFSIFLFRISTYRRLPLHTRNPVFSWNALSSIYKFAGGMVGITIVSLMLTQFDKIVLSKYVTLEEFGYFTIAFTVTSALFTLVTPVSQAFLPRLTQLVAQNSTVQLSAAYHLASQMVTLVLGTSAIILFANSEQVIFLWTLNIPLTENVSSLLALLTLGTLLNCIMWMPFQLQIAHGWTTLSLKLNIAAAIILVPTLFIIVPRFGSIGVAWIYIVLNLNLVIFGTMFMHRKLLTEEKYKWLFVDNLIPLVGGLIVCFTLKICMPIPDSYILKAARIILITISTFVTVAVLCSHVRFFFTTSTVNMYKRWYNR